MDLTSGNSTEDVSVSGCNKKYTFLNIEKDKYSKQLPIVINRKCNDNNQPHLQVLYWYFLISFHNIFAVPRNTPNTLAAKVSVKPDTLLINLKMCVFCYLIIIFSWFP